MVQNELVPYLRRKFKVRPVGASLTLRFVGVGQSQIDQTIREHVPIPPEVLVSSLFEGARVDFIFALPGNSTEDQAKLRQIETKLREHLGDYFYADDGASLEEWVVKQLTARGGPLVVVESGSGGQLAASLARVQDATGLLSGAFSAPTEEGLRRMLGIPEARWKELSPGSGRLKALAQAGLKATGSHEVIVVGQPGPVGEGARSVEVLFGLPGDRWVSLRLPFPGVSESAQASLATQIWDRLRRQL
jgi:nicotinamide-nucleotide amidase